MRQEELYDLLINNNVYSQIDVEYTKVFENDIVIEDVRSNKKYKIETDSMSKEDVIIALLGKQTLYIKTIKNIIMGFTILFIIGFVYLLFEMTLSNI